MTAGSPADGPVEAASAALGAASWRSPPPAAALDEPDAPGDPVAPDDPAAADVGSVGAAAAPSPLGAEVPHAIAHENRANATAAVARYFIRAFTLTALAGRQTFVRLVLVAPSASLFLSSSW
jgi:hypothetical protein